MRCMLTWWRKPTRVKRSARGAHSETLPCIVWRTSSVITVQGNSHIPVFVIVLLRRNAGDCYIMFLSWELGIQKISRVWAVNGPSSPRRGGVQPTYSGSMAKCRVQKTGLTRAQTKKTRIICEWQHIFPILSRIVYFTSRITCFVDGIRNF